MAEQDKPRIHDNLDTWENENSVESYAFVLNGERFVTHNPMEVDWRLLAGAMGQMQQGDARMFLELLLGKEDYQRFAKQQLPLFKFGRLAERIRDHYGMDVPQGNSLASSAT